MIAKTDARVFERIDKELGVRYSPQGTNAEFCSTTKNISGGGIRMPLLKKLKPGSVLNLEIFKNKADFFIRCRGKVAWVWDAPADQKGEQLFEAGIKFIDPHLLYIGRLMESL
jgi:hypothetical protein